MKFTLKKIRYMASLSQETSCYSADLYVDGKKIGEVANDGHGGPDSFHGDQAAYAMASAWVAENHPPLVFGENDEHSVKADIEIVCGQLLDDHLLGKALKKELKRSVLYQAAGKKGLMQIKFKRVTSVTDGHIEHVQKKYPDAKILNALPFDEAMEIYKNNS